MSLPVAATGALLVALLETSVLSELSIADIKPDLVLVLTVVMAMVVAFEDGLVWAVVGGLLVDSLTARPLGATTLALLLVIGMATLVTRVTATPRTITVALVTFALAWAYQGIVMAILAVTAGVAIVDVSVQRLFFIALLDLVVALVAVVVVKGLYRRFGPAERIDW